MIFTFVKFLIGAGLVAALLYFDFIDFSLFSTAANSPVSLLAATVFLLSTVFIGAWRWQILLSSLTVHISFKQSLNYTFIGQFFNVFLPGAYGGDFIRGGLAYRSHSGKLGEIMMSSLVDRLTGLVGLLLIALTVLVLIPSEYQLWIGIIIGVSLGAALTCLVIALQFQNIFRRIIKKFPSPIARLSLKIFDIVIESLESYWTHKSSLFFAIFLSFIQYVLVLESLYILGGAMEVTSLPWIGYIVSGVAGLFANAIPLSPGGLGIGEAAFGQIANLLETTATETAYSSIFLLMRSLTLVVAVIGLFPFLLYRDAVNAVTSNKETLSEERA